MKFIFIMFLIPNIMFGQLYFPKSEPTLYRKYQNPLPQTIVTDYCKVTLDEMTLENNVVTFCDTTLNGFNYSYSYYDEFKGVWVYSLKHTCEDSDEYSLRFTIVYCPRNKQYLIEYEHDDCYEIWGNLDQNIYE